MNILNSVNRIIYVLFWNKNENRIRAGWRIFLYFFLCSVGWAVGDTAAVAIFDGFRDEVAQVAVNVTVVIISTKVAAKYLDHSNWLDLGLHIDSEWILDLLVGLFIGLAISTATLAVSFATGWASVERVQSIDLSLLVLLLTGIFVMGCVAVNEELLFRGYIMQNTIDGFEWLNSKVAAVIAWLISSVLFMLFHANPAGRWSVTLHFVLAGMMFALPVLLRGTLAMGIGIHMMDNFVIAYIFGLGGEAIGVGPSLLTVEHGGPGFWFGGAGMIRTIAIFFAMLVIVMWAWWREGTTPTIQSQSLAQDPVDQAE